MNIYAIRSNKTGKYLSNLFENQHSKRFQGSTFHPDTCYWYRIKRVAEDIALNMDGIAVKMN